MGDAMQGLAKKKLAAGFLLSVLFLADAGFPCALFDCGSDRMPRHECCRPADGQKAAVAQRMVRPACCCPPESNLAAPLPENVVRYQAPAGVSVPVAPASFSRIVVLASPRSLPGGPEREPGVGPPIILLNRTLLI